VRRAAVLFAIVCAAVSGAQAAARPITSGTLDATRSELTRRLDSLSRVSPSAGKKNERRDRQNEIEALRARLSEGDFQSGDRFLIDYGDPTRRPDTVIVRDSSNYSLLNWPSSSLQGVLRAELQGAVEKYVSMYVREPRLRVSALTRLSFVGGVGRPGVYAVDPTRPLSDALNQAGGLGQMGKPDKITVYRGNARIMNEKRVAEAVRDGSTIEELGIQSGDQVRVAQQKMAGNRDWRQTIQPVLLGVSVFTALLAIIRASYQP
jgi:hypothetical protein